MRIVERMRGDTEQLLLRGKPRWDGRPRPVASGRFRHKQHGLDCVTSVHVVNGVVDVRPPSLLRPASNAIDFRLPETPGLVCLGAQQAVLRIAVRGLGVTPRPDLASVWTDARERRGHQTRHSGLDRASTPGHARVSRLRRAVARSALRPRGGANDGART